MGRIQEVGQVIQRSTRGYDLVAYSGVNRFGVVRLGMHLHGGRIAANRIESTLQTSRSDRVSIGLAAFVPKMVEPGKLVGAAEGALRAAEQSGGGVEMA
jgi:PleD family two-component response regulator